MLDRELEEFLRRPHFARLATLGADGYPQMTTMWYLYDGGHIYMSTTTERVKARNMRRNPKVAFIIDTDPYQGLAVKADVVRFITDDVEVWTRRVAARYTPPERLDAMVASLVSPTRIAVDLVPRSVVRIGTAWNR